MNNEEIITKVSSVCTEKEIFNKFKKKYRGGIHFFRIPFPKSSMPSPEALEKLIKILTDPQNSNSRIVFQCQEICERVLTAVVVSKLIFNYVEFFSTSQTPPGPLDEETNTYKTEEVRSLFLAFEN